MDFDEKRHSDSDHYVKKWNFNLELVGALLVLIFGLVVPISIFFLLNFNILINTILGIASVSIFVVPAIINIVTAVKDSEVMVPLPIEADVVVKIHKFKANEFRYNSSNKKFQYRKNGHLSKPYNIEDILSIDLIQNDKVVKKVKSGAATGKTVAGGILFGGWGAIAGALVVGSTEYTKDKTSYGFEITINDYSNAGVILDADRDGFFELVSVFKVLEHREEQKMT